jgi:hypothetical protein
VRVILSDHFEVVIVIEVLDAPLHEQQDPIQRYAQRNGIEISRSFEEQETAAKRGRPIFSAMIRLLRRGHTRGVIVPGGIAMSEKRKAQAEKGR